MLAHLYETGEEWCPKNRLDFGKIACSKDEPYDRNFCSQSELQDMGGSSKKEDHCDGEFSVTLMVDIVRCD